MGGHRPPPERREVARAPPPAGFIPPAARSVVHRSVVHEHIPGVVLFMHILITAGPTREYFDSVRFLSNASSGKMGYAMAAEAARRGHAVVLISGPVDRAPLTGVECIRVVSAKEMLDAAVGRFDECHAAVMAAAVCDYRPTVRADCKLPKALAPGRVALEATEDICARLGRVKGNRVVVGFALEDHDHHAHAEDKLDRKGCDAIVLNRPATIDADAGEIEVLRAGQGWSEAVRGTKDALAVCVLDLVEDLRRGIGP